MHIYITFAYVYHICITHIIHICNRYVCIYLWNHHHHNQDNEILTTLKSLAMPSFCAFQLFLHPPLATLLHAQATTNLILVTIDCFAFSTALYKWNHKVCTLLCLSSFCHHNYFEIYICYWVHGLFIPFLLLRCIPLCKYTMICLLIYLLINIWVVSSFWLLQIKLTWTFVVWKYAFISIG